MKLFTIRVVQSWVLSAQLSDWFCRGFCLPNYQIGSVVVFVCPTIRLVLTWFLSAQQSDWFNHGFWSAQLSDWFNHGSGLPNYKNLKKLALVTKNKRTKRCFKVQCIQYIHLACQGELTSEASF